MGPIVDVHLMPNAGMPVADQPRCDVSQVAKSSVKLVVGITHPQTCLVLRGRLLALREAGFCVTLVCSPGALFEMIGESEGVETIAVPIQRGMAPLGDIVSLFRLWAILRRIKPEIVEFSTPKAGLLGMMAAKMAGVPRRVYHLRGLKLESAAGLKRRILAMAERIAAACSDVVLCNSESLRVTVRSLRLVPSRKLQVLGSGSSNGVDTVKFSPGDSDVRQRLRWPKNEPVLGFVGRLTQDKGLPELIDAFELILEEYPTAHLLLAGWFDQSDDALTAEMRDRIERHPRVACTGYVDDASPYYRAMDLFVLPTRREGFPNVVLEASATGIPVITTLATGARDSVLHGVTGVLILPGDKEAICAASLELLRDPERRQRMGAAGRAWVTGSFEKRRALSQLVRFYEGLIPQQEERTLIGDGAEA